MLGLKLLAGPVIDALVGLAALGTVVDYKTAAVATADELDAATIRHSGQAAAYAIATERGTGLPVREVVFIYPRADAERSLARGELPTEHVVA